MTSTPNSTAAALFLLVCFVKAGLIFGCAWAGATLLRKRRAALRHEIWAAAILAALSMPLLCATLPGWSSGSLERAVARWSPAASSSSAIQYQVTPGTVIHAVSADRAAQWWHAVLLFVWAGVALVLLARLAINLWRMGVIAARSMPLVGAEWRRDAEQIARQLGLLRPVRLLRSASATAMPVTWGVFEHKVLLPAAALEWTEERRKVVLLHELAHCARRDSSLQVAAEIARALYWYDPLAWLATRQLRHESECACDDSVLNSGVQPCSYADHLIELARSLSDRGPDCSPALVLARSTKLERRFMAMLNSATDRRGLSWKSKVMGSVLALCLLVPLAAVRLAGQNESGKFSGTIYDPSGAATPNATIMMVDRVADTRDMTTSDASGNFQFTRLPAGDYELRVMKPGFKTFTVPSVTLQAGRDFSLNANLELGTLDENVQVTGQRPANPGGTAATGSNEGPKRIRMGGAVEAAHLFTRVMPVYPHSAKAAGVEGTVVLHAVVAKDGTLLSLRVMNGQVNPDLARAAVEAVSHWRYRPTLLNGQPVEIDTTIEVNFTLHS